MTDSTINRVIIEDNLVDLALEANSYAFLLSGASFTHSIDVAVLRGNRVRGLEGQALVNPSFGINLANVNRATVENNIVDSPSASPNNAARITDCASVHVFNNRRINGDLARVVNTNTGLYVPELTTDAEDVLLSL
jgi:hypothetical protein